MNALVAVDLRNEASARATAAAAAIWAGKLGATLDLLYCDEFRARTTDVSERQMQDEFREEWNRIDREDRLALSALFEGSVPYEQRGMVHIVTGESAATGIVRHGATYDLVILATNGRTGLAHLWLGSVAEQVVRTSHAPVLVLRAT